MGGGGVRRLQEALAAAASAAFFAAAASCANFEAKPAVVREGEKGEGRGEEGVYLFLAHDVGVGFHLGAERLAVAVGPFALVLVCELLLRLAGSAFTGRAGPRWVSVRTRSRVTLSLNPKGRQTFSRAWMQGSQGGQVSTP